jgi:signal transduction histidine kinase
MLLIETVALIEGFEFSPFLYMLPPYLAVVYFGKSAGYALLAFVEVVYIAKLSWYQPHWYLQRTNIFLVILFTFGALFVVTMARVVAREQASRVRAELLLAEVERSRQQLQTNAEQIAELATTEERNRVAREIHDSLGHALIAINVQLEKALIYYEQSPQEAVQAIADAKGVAKEALQDVRGSVRALRTPGIFFCTQSITSLVHQMQHGSLTVDLSVGGSEDGFSRQDLVALYRVAQESFTNIQKHAQARHVQVKLRFSEQEAYLSIQDNGCGFDPALLQQVKTAHAGGYGLQGMRERVELVRGSLQVNSQVGQGTTVAVTIPNRRGTLPSRDQSRLTQGARRT